MHAKLKIAEQFYSIQGEGPTAGTPSVFLRLSGCNLACSGFSYTDPKTGIHLGCDTKAVWKTGERFSNTNVLAYWETAGWIEALRSGAHLVVTGGEPLLQQDGLLRFLHHFQQHESFLPFIELETNATIPLQTALIDLISQLNASPKLSHSGEPASRRYHELVLKQIAAIPQAIFKFVISQNSDVNEMLDTYISPLHLAPHRICLMPEGGTRRRLEAVSPLVVDACKRYGFRYSPRLQVTIWEAVTGV